MESVATTRDAAEELLYCHESMDGWETEMAVEAMLYSEFMELFPTQADRDIIAQFLPPRFTVDAEVAASPDEPQSTLGWDEDDDVGFSDYYAKGAVPVSSQRQEPVGIEED
eukprot:764867-Hanusia_phi.AAC.10